jgi:predicted ATPase/class 3 adenylate cyclase
MKDVNPPPLSTVTFLFTDIEESSPLWDKRPNEMRLAMRFHDYVLSQVIERQGGRLFRKTGDGICAAFSSAIDALQVGLKVQTALQNMPGDIVLRVRMAIHSGPAAERDGDYDGEPLNRTARILGFGQGGQILLSRAAMSLMAPSHPDDVMFRELGTHALKGLSVEETIFQVLHPSLSGEAPAILAARTTGRLPASSSSFVGRSEQIAHLVTLLEQSRLVTLIGTGGIGKTRLAVEAASRCASSFEYGTWFIDLQNVVDPDKVMVAFAGAFSIKDSAGYGLVDAIRHRLGTRRMLLVVDNCEQIQTAAAEAISTVLEIAPRAHILATSREVLGLRGERVVRVAPLTVPSAGDPLVAAGTEAVRLFVDRALYANPSFRVTNDNLKPLCRLMERLDGIPLAIELSAARMRGMSLDQLVRRLDDLFSVLKSTYRDQMPRHQTLLATMDWSYRLLSEEEKLVFARLGVFAGSWSVDICEEVAGEKPLREDDVLDLLADLVDKSLVIAEERRGEMRYRLLETVRAYARAKLDEAPDAERIHQRFFQSMRSLAERLDAWILSHEQSRWRRVFNFEIDNFRTALDWGIQGGHVEEVAALLCDLARTWQMNGDFSEARGYFNRVEPMLSDAALELRARVLTISGNMRLRAGDRSGIDMMRRAIDYAEHVDRGVHVECVGRLAAALFELGEIDGADTLFRRVLELVSLPPGLPEGHLRLALGAIATERGEFAAAEEQYRVMLIDRRRSGDRRGEGLALCYLAHAHALQGKPETTDVYRDAIGCLAEVPDYYSIAANLGAASSILVDGSPESAARVQGYAEQLAERVGVTFDRHVERLAAAARSAAEERLRPDRHAEWFEDGKFLDLPAVLELMGCPVGDAAAPAFTRL